MGLSYSVCVPYYIKQLHPHHKDCGIGYRGVAAALCNSQMTYFFRLQREGLEKLEGLVYFVEMYAF